MLRPGIVGMRGFMVVRLRPCMRSSTLYISPIEHPPPPPPPANGALSETALFHVSMLVSAYRHRCGPCRMVGPVVDEVIADHGGKLKVLELCTDENPKTVAEFKIRNIPTLMLFNDRKSVLTVVGAVPKSALVSSIKKHMDL